MDRIRGGDPKLLDEIRAQIDPRHIQNLLDKSAYCWDVYPLPNGSLNPTKGTPNGFHATMSPGEQRVNPAMDQILAPLLSEDQKWVLTIPRGLVPGRGVDAELLLSSSGKAALALPWAAFGSLFYFNELFIILDIVRQKKSSAGEVYTTWAFWKKAVIHWFTGEMIQEDDEREILNIELAQMMWRRREGRGYNRFIWSTTVFQQCFLLLHEFGHLIDANRPLDGVASLQSDRSELHPLWQNYWGLMDELFADNWAIQCAIPLAKKFFEQPIDAAQSLLLLFTLLTIIRRSRGEDIYEDEYAARCMFVMRDLAPKQFNHLNEPMVLKYFANIRSLFED